MVVDSAELDRFPLLGVSQGAAVAVAFAVRHPERVSRMVLYGSYARGRRKRAGEAGRGRGGARHRAGPHRLGPRRPVVPPGVHVAVPPRRQPGRLGRVQRAAAPDDLAGERRALPRDVRRHRRHGRGPRGALPDADRARPRRPPGPGVGGSRAGGADPGQPVRAAPRSQPPAAPRRTGLAAVPRRARPLPRRGARVRSAARGGERRRSRAARTGRRTAGTPARGPRSRRRRRPRTRRGSCRARDERR